MKAFLSHSSKDKGFVEGVADYLRPGTYELDSRTFDAGLINSQAIMTALEGSDVFCLFLSEASTTAAYVDFETLLGIEFFARGSIGRFIAVCLDEAAFSKASAGVKFFNIVRKSNEVESTARLIQGAMISASASKGQSVHPFLGREDESIELEKQLTDHNRPLSKAIYVSGNYGTGRRTFARNVFQSQYRHVNPIFPTIEVSSFNGVEELYRKFLRTLRPSITASELRTRLHTFSTANHTEKLRLTAQMINSLLVAREAVFLVDEGGMLQDSGAFVPEINELIGFLEAKPHPPVCIIAPRMIPRKFRRAEDDISYVGLQSLKRESSERLLSRLLRDQDITVDPKSYQTLLKLSDSHPFNFYRMMEDITRIGVDAFLADPRNFIDWKHSHSSEYISKVHLELVDVLVLALLNLVSELDFSSIAAALPNEANELSASLSRLLDLHVLETVVDLFSVSPAMRVAVEKDRRFVLPEALQESALKSVSNSLSVRLEDGTAPVALIDAAVIASIQSKSSFTTIASSFILPSHYVWLANRSYDQKRYGDSIRLAREALQAKDRLSASAIIAAARFICLSAARLGESATFHEGIGVLELLPKDDWAKSNIEFLHGFNLRMKGHLPDGERRFRAAYRLSPGNSSAARELASVCLARNNLADAERFAREAQSHAKANPYHLDILISVLIRRHGKDARHVSELDDLFAVLEAVGEEGGKSFFSTRRAEFEHLWGSNKTALGLITKAVERTPSLFEPRRLQAEILLKDHQPSKAYDVIQSMHVMVNSRKPGERRSNYRPYLETLSHYYQEVGNFPEAKAIYKDGEMFSDEERKLAVKEIEIVESYQKK